MRDEVRVAAVSVDSQPGQAERNLEKIDDWTARAAGDGAQLVLFPELSLTGFLPNHPQGDHEAWLRGALVEARRTAIAPESEHVKTLSAIASRHRVLVSVGLLEDAGNALYNTQLLVGPEGIAGSWRKMHVPMFEMPFYNPGQGPTVTETPLARVGANICFDAFLPESTRLLAVQNVEVVLFPFAADPPPRTPAGWAAWAGPAIRARAVENGVFAVACNYVGRVESGGVSQEFPGGGLIVSPRGEVMADSSEQPGGPNMLLATLTSEELQTARAEPEYLFRFRRPELYGPLADPGLP
jgi:N-carbamoylputrescine amidase